MVERAYSVTPVCPPVSVRVQDSVSNLRLSFLGVSILHLSCSGGESVSFGRISSLYCLSSNIFVLILLLTHMSQRLRMSWCDYLLSTPLNGFTETSGPIFSRLYNESSLKSGIESFSNSYGPLTKMAIMPKYGKNHLISFLICSIRMD